MLAKEIQPDFPKDSPLSVTVFHGSCQMPHYHRDVFEFILCLSGRLQVRNMHEKHTLLPGDILQADTYDIHTIASKTAGGPTGPVAPTGSNEPAGSGGALPSLAASFHIDLRHPMFAGEGYQFLYYICSSDTASRLQAPQIHRIRSLLLAILSNRLHSRREQENIAMTKELLQIMRQHFQYFDHININGGDVPGEMKDRFERIMAYMLEHYDEKITMRGICDREHMSYTYLSRFFKESSLKTFRNFLQELRVYHSEHLLLCHPEMSVPDVGYRVGFSDPKFFYREFRKRYGHPPHQHRILYRVYNKSVSPDIRFDAGEHLPQIESCINDLFSRTVCELKGVNNT